MQPIPRTVIAVIEDDTRGGEKKFSATLPAPCTPPYTLPEPATGFGASLHPPVLRPLRGCEFTGTRAWSFGQKNKKGNCGRSRSRLHPASFTDDTTPISHPVKTCFRWYRSGLNYGRCISTMKRVSRDVLRILCCIACLPTY